MKILLVQKEIEEAISQYIGSSFTLPAGKKFNIEMSATRGTNGVTAEVEVTDEPRNEAEQVKTCVYKTSSGEVEAPVAETKPVKTGLFTETATEERPKAKKSFFSDLDS